MPELGHELAAGAIPSCPKCTTPMWVIQIEQYLGHDRRTYECPQCRHAIGMRVEHPTSSRPSNSLLEGERDQIHTFVV